MEHSVSIVLSTAPNEEIAANLAREIIKAELAACVNIVPNVRSIYRWQGKIEDEAEALMIIKAPTEKTRDLTAFIVSHHPYDLPEVISIESDSGNPDYLKWVLNGN